MATEFARSVDLAEDHISFQACDLMTEASQALIIAGVTIIVVSTPMEWYQILRHHASSSGFLGSIGLWIFGAGAAIRIHSGEDLRTAKTL